MPPSARPILRNADARRLFLHRHALSEVPAGKPNAAEIMALIERLGFVQVDSINTVERAHHMILFARRPGYRPAQLRPLLEDSRELFEHWTHDASIIPTAFFPHWQLRFARDREQLVEKWRNWRDDAYLAKFDEVLAQVANHGPVTSSDVGEGEERGKGGWWEWHPSKTALEYLWRTGALSVLRRDGFQKVYDLTERVHPEICQHCPAPEESFDWACNAAMDRLGFATSGEVAAFFAAVRPEEARDWCRAALANGSLIEIDVEGANGALRRSFARPDVFAAAEAAPDLPGRVRILSPFDPALRDRNRTERLFGYFYRIEVFTPEPKRIYGYYTFPLLEGARLIGRLDARAERSSGIMNVRAVWPERGVQLSPARVARIEAELERLRRFSGCDSIVFANDWLRAAV